VANRPRELRKGLCATALLLFRMPGFALCRWCDDRKLHGEVGRWFGSQRGQIRYTIHRMVRGWATAACCAVIFVCSSSFAFQGPLADPPAVSLHRNLPPSLPTDQPPIRVDSTLVTIPARVTTLGGVAVTNLRKEDFRVFEDNVEQTIVHFGMDDVPVSIGLVFDVSGSMSDKIGKACEAVREFFKTANPADEFFLIEFNHRVKLAVPFTLDSDLIYRAIVRTSPFGETSLLDALDLAMKQMKKAGNPHRAIVIVSDGGDNWSRHSAREIKHSLMESDAQVFAMGIFDHDYMTNHREEERRGPLLLDELAEQTGGQHYPVDNLDDLPAISTKISREMRNQYELGYYPSNPTRDGKYRQVKLTLRMEKPGDGVRLHADYRRGYYAPAN
jgi:Ca-activated chloride channel homolog